MILTFESFYASLLKQTSRATNSACLIYKCWWAPYKNRCIVLLIIGELQLFLKQKSEGEISRV